MEKEFELKKMFIKYREIIVYLIVGGMTTVVSFLSYFLFSYICSINYLVSNFLSWVCAVAFAYITNKIWVFQNHNFHFSYIKKECISFVGSRVATLLIDMIIMFAMVSLLHTNDLIAKVVVQVVVTILNYLFSKFFVFKNEK